MRTKHLTRGTLALAVLAATLVVVAPASAQEEDSGPNGPDPCTPDLAYTFSTDGNATVALEDVQAGDNVTVHFDLAGCTQTELSFVSYTRSVAGVGATFDSQTGVFAEGTGNLTIQVPDCSFELDFVFGGVVEAAGGSSVYEAAGSLIAAAEGGVGLCMPAVDLQQVEEMVCPSLGATANGDGSITLDLDAEATAGALLLYRAAGDEDMELLALFDGTTFVDTETEVGVSYTYAVVAVLGEMDTECSPVEVTSVPVFPGAVGMLAAVTLGVAGYVVSRRR